MQPFVRLEAVAAPLMRANIDTDMIIPKQFLKTVTRTGLATGLFHELKTRPDGSPDPDFVLNRPRYQAAQILIAGPNFGCGSSREHAPWALLDQGIRCVIASSFADIFYNNCFKNGILPLILPQDLVEALAEQAHGGNHRFVIDLPSQTLIDANGVSHTFQMGPARKMTLIEGLDEIGLSLKHSDAIAAHEARRAHVTPWLT
jgi:3-isopropylmalate/(R)-2-methylmalate dehydratase small subunit